MTRVSTRDRALLEAVNSPGLQEKLRARIDGRATATSNGCAVLTRSLNEHGYPLIAIGRTMVLASRLVVTLRDGRAPIDAVVMHTCDTPNCVTPDHLVVGTQHQNMSDCKIKGRYRAPRGASHCRSKLTEEQVREIKSLAGTVGPSELALKYGVSRRHIQYINSGDCRALG